MNSVEFLTLGISGLDFAAGIGAKTCDSATLSEGDTCIESVTFTPASPGQRVGAVVLLDSTNNVLGTAYLSGIGLAGLGVLSPGNVLPVAGNGDANGELGDGSVATAASLRDPSSVALDGVGNIYIADRNHNLLRKVTASTGIISTLAGNGSAAYTGDGLISTGPTVSINEPWGVAVDGAGNIYVADTGNNVVRKIDAASGIISTVAGNGTQGSGGDGSAATSAMLNEPQGVSIDASGNLYIADTSNHRIRKVDSAGIITTVAGNGTAAYAGDGGPASSAELNYPFAVAFDLSGNMYIPDSANNVVRKVGTSGTISSVAGTGVPGYSGDGAEATFATLYSPSGVAFDPAGNLYIADSKNAAIRKVSASTGLISTIAQNNIGEYVDTTGGPSPVSINAPLGLTFDSNADLYFADSLNMRVRKIQSNLAVLDYTANAVRQGDQSATQDQVVENDGNAPLDLTAVTHDNNAQIEATATTCSSGSPFLAANADCTIGAIFSPSTSGEPLDGTIDLTTNTVKSPLVIELIGNSTAVASTVTTLISNPNPSGFAAPVTFTATVTTGSGTGNLTGTVTFVDGSTIIAANVPVDTSVSSGRDTFARTPLTTSALTVGPHSIVATYNTAADPTHFGSTSQALNQIVLEGTATTLVSSVDPSAIGQSVTFTASVAPAGGATVMPDGTVTFTDGSATLTIVPLNANGVATFATSSLADGRHSITATYNGDAANGIAGSVSTALKQDVLQASVAVLTSSANPSIYAAPVTFTATVTPSGANPATGTVNFLDGMEQIGIAALTGANGIGILTTSSLTVGSHPITAAYRGDANSASTTSSALVQFVDKDKTSTVLLAAPNPIAAHAPIALTATVAGSQSSATPSGTVSFADTFNTATLNLGAAPLSPSGSAVLYPALATGSHSIVATYTGSANDSASSSASLQVIVQTASSTIALNSSPDPSVAESPVVFTAIVTGGGQTSAGAVNFFDGKTSIGSSTLNAKGVATLSYSSLAPGTHVMTASFPADASDDSTTSYAVNQVVGKIPTVTSIAAPSAAESSSQLNLLATVSGGSIPSGTVTLTNGATTLGSAFLNSVGAATFTPNLANGTYSIVASYAGDAIHSPSLSPAISVSGNASSFSFFLSPASVTIPTTQSGTVAVTLNSFDSFSDTIGLGCSSRPTGITCHFSAPSVLLAANSNQTAQLTIDTSNPLTGGASALNKTTKIRLQRNISMAAISSPLALAFCFLFARFRKRLRFALSIASLLLLAAAAITTVIGCTAFSQATAKPGTYVIQVTGTGAISKLSRYQNLTLNITK